MAITYKHVRTLEYTIGGETVSYSKVFEGSSQTRLLETIPDASTNLAVGLTIDVSAVKAILIASDQPLLIETNSGSAPDDTITLEAGEPYEWNHESAEAFALTTDVASLFITNASGEDATLRIELLTDATP